MLKKSILSLLILCLHFNSFSQPKITLGKPYEVIDGQLRLYFYKDNELLSVKKDGPRLYLQKFNLATLSHVSMNEFRIAEDGFESIMRDIKGLELYNVTPNRITSISPSVFVFEAYRKKGEEILVKVDLSNQ
jgi:hypothetical protein